MRNFFILLLTSLFLFNCTDPVTELKENIYSAQDNALVENEYNSTIEAMTDWVANTKFYKKGDRIIPGNVKVDFKDSTFIDLDGVEGSIDFGAKGKTKPYGLLCGDGKYRAGKIHFKLSKPVELAGSVFQLIIEKSDSFYSGSGETMNLLFGKISIENRDGWSLLVIADKLNLVGGENKIMEWNCIRIIKMIKDAGKGIWGDIYSLEGSADGTNRIGEKFEVNIEQPLIKKMENGCSKTFVKGILSIKNDASDKTIRVDYDPNKDEACDNLIEADINGKKTVFKLD
ncbi:MAG: hypothetical protein ACKVQB_10795 [Bacteroidia bacterium]